MEARYECNLSLLLSSLTPAASQYTCGLPRIEQAKGKNCVVYSFGVERESSFEAEILRRTDCSVFLYDYSVKEYGPHIAFMEEEAQKRAHFFQYGIAGENMEKVCI